MGTRTVFQTYGTVNAADFDGYIRGCVSFTPSQALVSDEGTTLVQTTAAAEVAPTEESGVDYLSEFTIDLVTTDEFGGDWQYLVREELWQYDSNNYRQFKILDRQFLVDLAPGGSITLEELREGEESSS